MLRTLLLLFFAAVPAAAADGRIDAVTAYGAARIKLGRDELPAAAKQFEAAAKADPAATAPRRDLVGVYVELGRDAAAVRVAEETLRLDPADADTAHTLARLYFSAKRPADAAAVLRPFAETGKPLDRPAKALAVAKDFARCTADAGRHAAAAAAYLAVESLVAERFGTLRKAGFAAADLHRESAAAAEAAGRAWLRAGKPTDAGTAFERAAATFADPARANDPAAAARLGWHRALVANADGDTPAALGHLDRFLKLGPRSAEPYTLYANLLRAAGRGDTAADTLDRLAAADPDNPAAKWAAAAERGRTDFPAADVRFRDLASQTADAEFFTLVVSSYAAANRPGDLLELADGLFRTARPAGENAPADRTAAGERAAAISDALANSPFLTAVLTAAGERLNAGGELNGDLIDALAWAATRGGRIGHAEKMLRAAVRGPAGEKPAAPLALLQLLARQRRWDEMMTVCDAGTRRPRGAFFFYSFRKAEALVELGRGDEGLAVMAALDNDLRFPARRERVRLLGVLDRFPEMLTAAETLERDAATPAEVRQARMLKADALRGRKRFADAEEVLRNLLELDPDDVLVLNNLGYHLADENRKLLEAEAMIRRALDLDRDERARAGLPDPENANYLDSLAWVRFRRGDFADARRLLERAVSLEDGEASPVEWDHLGDVRFRLGDKAAAAEAWTKAAERYADTHLGRQAGRLAEVNRKLTLTK